MSAPPAGGAGWERATREHRAALAAFLETARSLDAAAWARPMAAGKWSPAQVAEHLALAYEAALGELAGRGAMRPMTGPWMRQLLRWVLLPHVLFHRSIPLRARAPREIRPGGPGIARAEVAARLGPLAAELERALLAAPDPSIDHPYFGRLAPVTALRFCAVHIDHHRRQIERAAHATP